MAHRRSQEVSRGGGVWGGVMFFLSLPAGTRRIYAAIWPWAWLLSDVRCMDFTTAKRMGTGQNGEGWILFWDDDYPILTASIFDVTKRKTSPSIAFFCVVADVSPAPPSHTHIRNEKTQIRLSLPHRSELHPRLERPHNRAQAVDILPPRRRPAGCVPLPGRGRRVHAHIDRGVVPHALGRARPPSSRSGPG